MKKIAQILYSGLGGTGSVAFSLLEAAQTEPIQWQFIFYGIEDLRQEYIDKCEAKHIPYCFIKKEQSNKPAWSQQNEVRKKLNEWQPDCVICHSNSLILQAYAYKLAHSNTKLIAVEHQPLQLIGRKEKLLGLLYVLCADHAVVLTPLHLKAYQKAYSFLVKNTQIIPNGIDINFFQPLANKKEEQRLKIGMIARLSTGKDHPTLIRAFALLKDKDFFSQLELRIAGDGTTRKALEQLSKDLGIDQQVVFTGMLNEEELLAFLQDLDIYVHATLGEAMSTAIMQAQAVGLPIIASDVDGVSNIFTQEENGLLVPVQNAAMLAKAMEKLVVDNDLRKKLCEVSRTYALDHLSQDRTWQQYRALIF